MIRRVAIRAVVLVGAAVGGWTVGKGIPSHVNAGSQSALGSGPIPWTDSLYALHTTHVQGAVSRTHASALRTRFKTGPAILVLLDRIDLSNCGDLGRQIRNLIDAVEPGVRLLVSAGDTPREELEWFLKFERLKLTIVEGIQSDSLWATSLEMPTPAAIWLDPRFDYGIGVGHIPRFPYIRSRSFAEELAPLYAPDGRGDGGAHEVIGHSAVGGAPSLDPHTP